MKDVREVVAALALQGPTSCAVLKRLGLTEIEHALLGFSDDVAKWLEELGLGEYTDPFADNAVGDGLPFRERRALLFGDHNAWRRNLVKPIDADSGLSDHVMRI